ncbi:rhomboid family intramembrane serine protease [Anaerococcus sp. NML200537]|uniref:rhomboid family intramembrane serine protease n=1 Tax=unclassified Anaerococcus TaxID=2614126 RepID=UPI000D0B7305|nr:MULTISPECIES: rhomboid family intramembrane serine protease [unclassified Anaerococcus]MCW6702253.1 rhomboid family intramembrane serine protease [Anaerococcus sp. NML200537]
MNINLERLSQAKVTSALMIINVIVFVLMSLSGGSESIENLIRFGANSKILVGEGDWWRLFTASFIHIGFFHIMFNMYFLYNIGPIFERLYGSVGFLIIYLVCGIFGNLVSYAFGDVYTVSAGASTSLYGLLGIAIGMMLVYRDDAILHSFGASFVSIVVINVIYSFLMPGVGVLGHLGGFVGGFILANALPVVGRDLSIPRQVVAGLATLALAFILIRIGNKSLLGV